MSPVDLPPFLTGLLTRQIQDHPHPPCGCAAQHGGSGRYVFLGPDGGHYRRSNYARRVFRSACDGRHEAAQQPARQARHRRRHHLARRPHRRLATRRPIRGLRAAARPGHPGHPRRHTPRLLAPDQARPDRARAQARPQDLDGRGRHPRDPRRAAPRPPGPRHARPLRPRLRPDARRPQARTPDPMGRLPTRPLGHQPALTRPAARRAADSRGDPPESGDTRRQGEDDLPNSSQPPRQHEAADSCDTRRTGINSV